MAREAAAVPNAGSQYLPLWLGTLLLPSAQGCCSIQHQMLGEALHSGCPGECPGVWALENNEGELLIMAPFFVSVNVQPWLYLKVSLIYTHHP